MINVSMLSKQEAPKEEYEDGTQKYVQEDEGGNKEFSILPNTEKIIQPGDIFVLGNHRLICGDARDSEIVRRLFADNPSPVSLLLTDPPYGIDYVASKKSFSKTTVMKHDNIANDDLSDDTAYARFTHEWLTSLLSYLAKRNSMYIFNSDRMIFALREGMKMSGVKLSQLLVWIKDAVVIGRLDYLPQHELIAYGWHGTHLFRGPKAKSILAFAKTRKNTIHPTMKPIPLLREIILNGSEMGDIVYDPFGGSGSTLIACEQTGRVCCMIETDPVYCARILHRWETLTRKQTCKYIPS